MASKDIAPTDPLTKMPLPILPPADMEAYAASELNWHHHYHPANSNLLTSPAGLAVRHVRLQHLPILSHHDVYHSMFDGPVLPRTNAQRFGHIVLASAGYIPGEAIDVHSDDPSSAVRLSKKMRRRLQSSGEIETRGHANISEFIKDYLVRQDLSHVDDSIIDEFINTTSIERKKYLGHWLLAIASEVAVEPVEPIYHQALSEGLIISPKSKLPNIVKSQINGRNISKKAISSLHKRFMQQKANTLQTGVDAVQLSS